jgi:tRNA1(Val) A37 N6-methylase TrmN6
MTTVEANEIFTWKEISVKQDGNVFKVGTDALLLGTWVPKMICDPTLILDVGTGTGIISLMMALSYPDSIITAIDIREEAIHLARYNFQNSKWHERLKAIQEIRPIIISSFVILHIISTSMQQPKSLWPPVSIRLQTQVPG